MTLHWKPGLKARSCNQEIFKTMIMTMIMVMIVQTGSSQDQTGAVCVVVGGDDSWVIDDGGGETE